MRWCPRFASALWTLTWGFQLTLACYRGRSEETRFVTGAPGVLARQVRSTYSHPFVLAIRAASTRFAAPSLLIASDK